MKEILKNLSQDEERRITIVKSFCEEFNEYALPILAIFGYTSDSDILRWGREGMDFKKLFDEIDKSPAFEGWDPRLARVAADQTLRTSCYYRPLRTRIADPKLDEMIIFEFERLRMHLHMDHPDLLSVKDGRLVVLNSTLRRARTVTVKAERSFFIKAAVEFTNKINEWIDDAPDLDLNT